MKRFLKSLFFLLAPLLLIFTCVFIYLLIFPLHPVRNRYARLMERRATHNALAYQDEIYVGNYQRSLFLADSVFQEKISLPLRADFLDYRPVDALQFIDSVAGHNRAIFVNEEHDNVRQRAFTILLLHELRSKGYKYFAAEALSYADADLQRRQYPLAHHSGTYIDEPVYGDILRTALQLGYTLVPYEAHDATSRINREQQQALNLIHSVFERDSTARLLVHAGYGHINDGPGSDMMGSYFKRYSGIDPLTIDQVTFTERSDTCYERPEYRSATARGLVSRSIFLRNDEGRMFNGLGRTDLAVFHPRSTYVYGRPDWMSMGGKRKPHFVDITRIAPEAPFLVQAFVRTEKPERRRLITESLPVPLDQIEIQDKSSNVRLYLYPGEYVIAIVDPRGNTFQTLAAVVH